jgi:V/A-type H+-transporting ATPase subunit I
MAVAEVKKITILAHAEIKEDLISSLQELGSVQIDKVDTEELKLDTRSEDVSSLDHLLHRLAHAIDFLSSWDKGGFAKKLFSGKPEVSSKKREMVLREDFVPIVERIEGIESQKNDLTSRMRFLEKEREFLEPLLGLDIPIKEITPTIRTHVLLGVMPPPRYKEFSAEIEDEALWHHVIFQDKRRVFLLMGFLKEEEPQVESILREMDFRPLHFTEPILSRAGEQDKVADVSQTFLQEIDRMSSDIGELEEEGSKLIIRRGRLMQAYDVLLNEKQKRTSSSLMGETEHVFLVEGWIAARDIKSLEKKLAPVSEYVTVEIRPPATEEEPPVILENPRAGKPFELITKLYGHPMPGTVDPTLLLAPFFFIFVGLTVSEAGYGLLVTLLCLLYITFGKPKGGVLRFVQLLAILGVSTVILGTLVGGWFGFPIRKLMVLDPLKDPVSFLILALALGFIQVWFGTLVEMISRIRHKEYLYGIFVQGGWLVLLPSLVLYGVLKASVFGILALVGAAGIILFAAPSKNPIARFFGGLYSLYDISRYLADILSYSRLLALGLATSVIAMVVNTLCQTALGIPWVGWLVAALIFVGGHLFNLGISFLGGFVHSMRLQFVEFFSKFFKSGGKPFKAFALESRYVDFV